MIGLRPLSPPDACGGACRQMAGATTPKRIADTFEPYVGPDRASERHRRTSGSSAAKTSCRITPDSRDSSATTDPDQRRMG